MKPFLPGITVLCGAALLAGCPVYSNDRYCTGSGCYDCPNGTSAPNGACIPWTCGSAADCPTGYACDVGTYTCVNADASPGGGCPDCPADTVCGLVDGGLQCVALDASVDAQPDVSHAEAAADVVRSEGSTADASLTDVVTFDASLPDASTGSDAPGPTAAPCNADAACGGNGAKCIDGLCVPQGQLCSDTTQCVVSGEACVNGVCEPHCSPSAPCPTGYACDFNRGVCDVNPDPCPGSGASTCLGGSVCVEERCVPPCAPSDAGNGCPGGQLCVNGGCIPDEAARFTCKNDGQNGLLANECSPNQVCLHHDCYAQCDPADGGACADPSTMCKQVRVTEGTYAACATPENLGNDCDPSTGSYCAKGLCIDGYCR